jgi:hypothetical protein
VVLNHGFYGVPGAEERLAGKIDTGFIAFDNFYYYLANFAKVIAAEDLAE